MVFFFINIKNYIKKLKIDYSLTNTKIFLFGFSQGAMIALHYGLRDEESFGGILAFSGSLISPDRLSEIKNKSVCNKCFFNCFRISKIDVPKVRYEVFERITIFQV